jgi:hypothetical protein
MKTEEKLDQKSREYFFNQNKTYTMDLDIFLQRMHVSLDDHYIEPSKDSIIKKKSK